MAASSSAAIESVATTTTTTATSAAAMTEETTAVSSAAASASPRVIAGGEGRDRRPHPQPPLTPRRRDDIIDSMSCAADVVTCAWSLSSVMNAQWGGDRWHESMRQTLCALRRYLDPVSGGTIIIVETLGTMQPEPTRSNTLHVFLAAEGFQMVWCRTDYKYPTCEIGARCVKFFFGQPLMEKYLAEGRPALMECTGVWSRSFPGVGSGDDGA